MPSILGISTCSARTFRSSLSLALPLPQLQQPSHSSLLTMLELLLVVVLAILVMLLTFLFAAAFVMVRLTPPSVPQALPSSFLVLSRRPSYMLTHFLPSCLLLAHRWKYHSSASKLYTQRSAPRRGSWKDWTSRCSIRLGDDQEGQELGGLEGTVQG